MCLGELLNPPGVTEIKWKMEENVKNRRMRISENVCYCLETNAELLWSDIKS